MAYTSGLFYIDLEAGSDTARTALTTVTVSNPSGTITRCNKTAHGLTTGAVVDLTLFTAWLNVAWKITVVDADNFDLDTAVWQTTGDASGTVAPRGGSSKADAWLTMASGATAARIDPGDTIRIKASPNETLVGNATWNQYSKTITLAAAVSTNISLCETAWTASANVTCGTNAFCKQGSNNASNSIAAGFTTGLAAYFPTGTLDLSGYQQVSFWLYVSATVAASTLSLRLCSDAAGVTTVNTIAIPVMPVVSVWTPITVDLGTNLGASIQSIALYADLDPGAVVVYLDNILACKAASAADSLTFHSLIGKACNVSWVASATYAVADERIPTQPNRNGYRYQVTAQTGAAGGTEPIWLQTIGATVTDGLVTWVNVGLEDSWFCLQSMSGTTVALEGPSGGSNGGRGYSGLTETVATYKREAIKYPLQTNVALILNSVQDSGTAVLPITFSGGWDITNMTAQTGETWIDAQIAKGLAYYTNGKSYVVLKNLNSVRTDLGMSNTGVACEVYNSHHNHAGSSGYYDQSTRKSTAQGISSQNSGSYGLRWVSGSADTVLRAISTGGSNNGVIQQNDLPFTALDFVSKNSASSALNLYGGGKANISGFVSANNSSGVDSSSVKHREHRFFNASIAEATPFTGMAAFDNTYFYSQKHAQTADNHLITTDGGTIISATDQRHTASDISWKFRPTSTNRHIAYPLKLSIAKIAVATNALVTLSIWTRRDSTNIKGQLLVRGGQIAGVGADVTVDCEPSINTWTQSSNLTFTPTEAGVIEVMFLVWDGVGTTNNFWVDDFARAQA